MIFLISLLMCGNTLIFVRFFKSRTLLNLPPLTGSAGMGDVGGFLRFSIYIIMSSAVRDTFTSFFLIWMSFLTCLTALAKLQIH